MVKQGNGRLIRIFTPSGAEESDTNAQNLTVKEIVARLPEDLFHVTMCCAGGADPRIAQRKNTRLLRYYRRGNIFQLLARSLAPPPEIYFYPRTRPLDRIFLTLRKILRLHSAVVTHIVTVIDENTGDQWMKRCVLESDAVFANSDFVGQTVQQRFGVHVPTMYNGIDRRFFFPPLEPRLDGKRPLRLLYTGSFKAGKRVELVIRQAARWKEVEFRLVGKGETEPRCRELVAQLGCKNVTFVGHLSPAQVGEEMRQADIFLFPSILEGHPQVLGQAAGCGLPVIAMNVYHPDYVVNGETGFLVESDTELAERLDLLLRDSTLRHTMSVAAARHAQKFDWDRIAQEWSEVFLRVAKL